MRVLLRAIGTHKKKREVNGIWDHRGEREIVHKKNPNTAQLPFVRSLRAVAVCVHVTTGVGPNANGRESLSKARFGS